MVEVGVDTKGLSESAVLLAQFQHARARRRKRKKLKFSVYQTEDDHDRRILTAQGQDMVYVGSTTDLNSTVSNNLMRLYVGVVDPTNKQMSILPASLTTMLPLQPGDSIQAKLDLSDDDDENGDMTTEVTKSPPKTPADKMQQQYRLVQSFGSEKQKRFLANARRGIVDSKDLDTSMTNSLETFDYHTEEESLEDQTTDTVIPPHNSAAKIPSEVYNIRDIISPGELASLSALSQLFTSATPKLIAEWRTDEMYPGYVLEHLPTSEEGEAAQKLYYLSNLVKFYRKKRKTLKQTDLAGIPDVVQHMILSRFTMSSAGQDGGDSRTDYVLPSRMKDKLLCHILLLALFIDNFSFDITVLQKDLQIDNTRLCERLQALGCKVSGGVGDNPATIATLSVPPSFPKSAKKSRKRKRET
ncbi:DNA-directed RNA polymerase I subunit RPA49-like [Dysidea avara]|uniref:DNA-directed RNA polymerase I subunit RPA49-like n=1 Tax=Dysidea avara TaxID=196820 RepID=UPI00332EEA86